MPKIRTIGSSCFIRKNLDNLKIKLQSKGFNVQEWYRAKKPFIDHLERFLLVSTPYARAEYGTTKGKLIIDDEQANDEDYKLLRDFHSEYRIFTGYSSS